MEITLKNRLYLIVFHSNTRAGKTFDLVLLWAIIISVLTVILESIPTVSESLKEIFRTLEWIFTILFTLEYILRIIISPKPLRYIFSFWGFVDFIASIPTYLSFFITGAQLLIVVRLIRLLRVFRILKMVRFTKEAKTLLGALRGSSYKIIIFLSTVLILVLILGTLMYVVEGDQEGFSSIPQAVYWAIVTITTVGYGDLVPQTVLGKFISSVIMIIGYSIIAVPTGIVTAEMSRKGEKETVCLNCGFRNQNTSRYCSDCGTKIDFENKPDQE